MRIEWSVPRTYALSEMMPGNTVMLSSDQPSFGEGVRTSDLYLVATPYGLPLLDRNKQVDVVFLVRLKDGHAFEKDGSTKVISIDARATARL